MTVEAKPPRAIKVVLSYSHKDKNLKEKLLTHLSPMKRQGFIESWDDQQIEAGSQWNEEISKQFNEADVILCLISANFINSDYCYEVEMHHALERRKLGEVEVIPILLKAVNWEKTPFHTLQAIPRDNKPIANCTNKEKALAEVAKEIERVIKAVLVKKHKACS